MPSLLDMTKAEVYRVDSNLEALVPKFIVNGRPNRVLLDPLVRELDTVDRAKRERVVHLLTKVGLRLDVPAPGKRQVIRDPYVIEALLDEGFALKDSAASASERALFQHCRPEDLRPFGKLFAELTRQKRSLALLLTAKAKAVEARDHVDAMVSTAAGNATTLLKVRITRAALGDIAEEDAFLLEINKAVQEAPPAPLSSFYDVGSAKDGSHIAPLIKNLGYIGTKRSLLAVCSFLRSDLKTYIVDEREQSLRFDAVKALRFNFPDEAAFDQPYRIEHWLAAEEYCRARLGASFEGPFPGLPTDFGYPR